MCVSEGEVCVQEKGVCLKANVCVHGSEVCQRERYLSEGNVCV